MLVRYNNISGYKLITLTLLGLLIVYSSSVLLNGMDVGLVFKQRKDYFVLNFDNYTFSLLMPTVTFERCLSMHIG